LLPEEEDTFQERPEEEQVCQKQKKQIQTLLLPEEEDIFQERPEEEQVCQKQEKQIQTLLLPEEEDIFQERPEEVCQKQIQAEEDEHFKANFEWRYFPAGKSLLKVSKVTLEQMA